MRFFALLVGMVFFAMPLWRTLLAKVAALLGSICRDVDVKPE